MEIKCRPRTGASEDAGPASGVRKHVGFAASESLVEGVGVANTYQEQRCLIT